MVQAGEMGYPSVLTAKGWGFYHVLFRGRPFTFQRPYGSYVMENVLFKISYPAEFHAQTAVEAAMALRAKLLAGGKSAEDITSIELRTHEACLRIIDKKGPLNNPADRDHCVQYMVAVPLIFGHLTASDYEDSFAADPRIDALREKMRCSEEPAFTADYHDPEKRSIANSLTLTLSDGSTFTETVEYPLGHRRREARASLCWKRSSAPTSAAGSRRSGSRRSLRPRLTNRHSSACRCRSTLICIRCEGMVAIIPPCL